MAYIGRDKIPYYIDTSEEAPMEGRKIAFKSDIDKLPTADVEEIKSEAVKEFAERLKSGIGVMVTHIRNGHAKHILELIDNLVKEMDGGNKNGL